MVLITFNIGGITKQVLGLFTIPQSLANANERDVRVKLDYLWSEFWYPEYIEDMVEDPHKFIKFLAAKGWNKVENMSLEPSVRKTINLPFIPRKL